MTTLNLTAEYARHVRDLMTDLELLISRYNHRSSIDCPLSADERKEWAEQMVSVSRRLSHRAALILPREERDGQRLRLRMWRDAFLRGVRIPKPRSADVPMSQQKYGGSVLEAQRQLHG
jgi:hypothetical protein